MFWTFNALVPSNINSLLSEEDITLERLMDEDDILQECKIDNKKLINYLTRPEILKELVSLVTQEPPEDRPEVTRFKYNNVACELLTCDAPLITEALAADTQLLGQLCDFLNADPPVNPLMASFFSRTLSLLVTRRSMRVVEFLKQRPQFLERCLLHLGTSAFMDLILKLASCVEGKDIRANVMQWLTDERLILRLVALLDPCSNPALHPNVSQLLVDMLRILRDAHFQAGGNHIHDSSNADGRGNEDGEPLLIQLESQVTIETLLSHVLKAPAMESCVVGGVSVLLALLEPRRPSPMGLSQDGEAPESNLTMPALTRHTIAAVLPRLLDLHNLLLNPPQLNLQQKAAWVARPQLQRPPFGATRLHIARLLCALLNTESWEVCEALVKLKTFPLLLDLMVQYPLNNFLHSQAERSLQMILAMQPTRIVETVKENGEQLDAQIKEPEYQTAEDSHPLLIHLLTECQLVQRLLAAWEENRKQEAATQGQRLGYMGHLTLMANHLVEESSSGQNAAKLQQLLEALPPDVKDNWKNFVSTQLTEINKKNEIIPIQTNPVTNRSSSDDEDSGTIQRAPKDTAIQQMETMSQNFVSPFGFSDNQFHSDDDRAITRHGDGAGEEAQRSTEEASSKRVPAFGSDDDEDIWLERERPRLSAMSSSDHIRLQRSSSSDEDSDDGDLNQERVVKMEVDQTDPWAGFSASIDAWTGSGPPAPAAPQTTAVPAAPVQTGWADFSTADFGAAAAVAAAETEESAPSPIAPMEVALEPPQDIENNSVAREPNLSTPVDAQALAQPGTQTVNTHNPPANELSSSDPLPPKAPSV